MQRWTRIKTSTIHHNTDIGIPEYRQRTRVREREIRPSELDVSMLELNGVARLLASMDGNKKPSWLNRLKKVFQDYRQTRRVDRIMRRYRYRSM